MTTENEKNTTRALASYLPTMETLSTVGWQAANFSFTVFLTSGLITLVHSPLNSFMLNQIKHGRFLPETNIGLALVMRNLYAGFGACFAGTGTRTAYMSGVKKIEHEVKNDGEISSEENIRESIKTTKGRGTQFKRLSEQLGYYSAISLGELVVTQVSEVLSQLQKLNIIDQKFKWYTPYNLYKLSITTSGARFGFALINFISLCGVENFYAQQMSIDDLKAKHFCAGAASGMTAAVFSYPFSYYRDYRLSKVVVVNGCLSVSTVLNYVTGVVEHIKTVGMMPVVKGLAKEFCAQAPLRMARTGTRFALIAGVSAACGEEPLQLFRQSGFFSRKTPVVDETKTAKSNRP